MMMNYKIILPLRVINTTFLWQEWMSFACNKINHHSEMIEIVIEKNQYSEYNLEILDDQPGKPVLKSNDCLLCVNSDWSKVKLTSFDGNRLDIYKLLNAAVMTHLSVRQTIEMHASLVDRSNKGLMFLGPSGIGKTTQAELWMKYRDAEIINGDMVFVKQEEDCFLGCGSPWHGSSPYCLNRQVPLAAMIVLKQSSENSIRRLSEFEMVSVVMNSVFFPTWYKEGHEAACKTLDGLLKQVPVYELSCRPDEEAVQLTEEAVFGRG